MMTITFEHEVAPMPPLQLIGYRDWSHALPALRSELHAFFGSNPTIDLESDMLSGVVFVGGLRVGTLRVGAP